MYGHYGVAIVVMDSRAATAVPRKMEGRADCGRLWSCTVKMGTEFKRTEQKFSACECAHRQGENGSTRFEKEKMLVKERWKLSLFVRSTAPTARKELGWWGSRSAPTWGKDGTACQLPVAWSVPSGSSTNGSGGTAYMLNVYMPGYLGRYTTEEGPAPCVCTLCSRYSRDFGFFYVCPFAQNFPTKHHYHQSLVLAHTLFESTMSFQRADFHATLADRQDRLVLCVTYVLQCRMDGPLRRPYRSKEVPRMVMLLGSIATTD